MMLQVKNSKISLLLGRGGVGLLLLCAVSFTACKSDPFVDPGDVVDPQWTVPAGSDMTASMTAIVDVTFAKSQGTLAAFVGDECCGVTRSTDFVDSLYYILITAPKAEGNVQLRFYSPDLKRIFLANETFPFGNDTQLGSPDKPYTPTWTVAK